MASGEPPTDVPGTPVGPSEQSPGGSHTAGGVTVADLFAKITGDIPEGLRRRARHGAGEDGPAAAEPWPHEPDLDDAPTVPTPSAYAAEVPDLGAVRVAPRRIGRRRAPVDPAPRTHHGSHRSMLLAGRSVAAIIAVLALALTGGAWQWTSSKNNRLNNIAALDLDSRDIVDPNAQFGDENFLIVGVDSRFGENSDMGAGDTEAVGGARSDTLMLVNIPANRKRVVAVSFPRDLAITPMKCEAWDAATGEYGPVYDEETGSYGPEEWYTETKLNSAYSYGGPKCLVKVIQKISGLSINRFMAVDFAGFEKMVDALGGVEVCSTTPLQDDELGTVLPTSGRQVVDGVTALNYVRARKVTTEFNGDYGRIKRQQMFLSSLLRSMISKETFFSLKKLNNVVNLFINDSYVDNITTKDLVNLGQSIQGVSAGRITFVTVPTTGITDADGNEEPNTDGIRALFSAIIDDDPLPGENDENEIGTPVTTLDASVNAADQHDTASATTDLGAEATELVNAVTTEPQNVSVHVSNSTDTDGLGATASTELEGYGFNVDSPDDYPISLNSTTVMYSPGNEQAAATVAASFGDPRIERMTGLGSTVHVILGPDFWAVGTPPASGSQVSVHVTHGASTAPTSLPDDLTITNGADTTCE